jgi:hypothetical protein
MRRRSAAGPIIITIILVILVCCLCFCLIAVASGAGLIAWLDTLDPYAYPITSPATQPTPGPLITTPVDASAYETLATLEETIIPINDPVDLAERLGGLEDVPVPHLLIDPNAPYSVGAVQEFWVTNVDSNENFRITARLRYVGENTYIWIEEGVEYDEADLVALGDTFDEVIVPTNRDFFGMEWNPGVDGDPHIYVVYAGGLGMSLAGYYSSADQVHPLAHEYSNAHEMFLINSDNVYLREEYIYGTLAHEFQHMIHWYTDRNEATWMNEGFSMLAELINGYDIGGHDYSYLRNTDVQLTDWGDEVGSNSPYYGGSFLFMAYFLDRFGENATKSLVAHPENSMQSIDLVLKELNLRDPQTDRIITGEDVFADWAVTNYLQDSGVGDGRYDYSNYNPGTRAALTETISGYIAKPLTRGVHQFGVDYIRLTDLEGQFSLNFTGSTTVGVMPTDAYSGDYAFYSNKGDESDMTLTKNFDFTDINGPITISYHTWYDLEVDYDYLYLTASTDGEHWDILKTPSCTTLDPSGNSYGCGYNGSTSGWIEEHVDLSQFAGQSVTLRFEYVTDAAVNGEGFLLDDVTVEAIGYFSDFETDTGGWIPAGFARVTNALPQTFRVSLITRDEIINVVPIHLSDINTVSIDLTLSSGDEVILVVSGVTPYTNQTATYQVELEQK